MTSPRSSFLDTDVLLRLLARDDREKGEGALELLLRVERREEWLITTSLVIFETIFTLQKSYGVPRSQIRAALLPVLGLRNLELADKHVFEQALGLFATTNLSFADAYNVTYMRHQHVSKIYSWDADFDRLPDIQRIEPGS